MGNVYEKIVDLCDEKGITPSGMCREINVAKSLLTELKSGRSKSLSTSSAIKISDYFKIPSDFLLERPPFDHWELINSDRKNFLICSDVDTTMLDIGWRIDPEDPDSASIRDFICFLHEAIIEAHPIEQGGWEIEVQPLYKKLPTLTQKGERDFAKNALEEDMLLLARHMEPIPEEDRQALKRQFKNSIDLYLKAKGLST